MNALSLGKVRLQQMGYLSATDFAVEESTLHRRDFDYTYKLIDTDWNRHTTGSFFNRSTQIRYLTSIQCHAPELMLESTSDNRR